MLKLAPLALTLLVAVSVFSQTTNPASTRPPVSKSPSPQIAGLPSAAEQAMTSVEAQRIRAHVKFLASDLLEGRGTGQRGGDIAAEYIATQFASYGLKPAGDDGGYMQKVPLNGIATQDDSTVSLVPGSGAALDLVYRKDFVATDETGKTRDDLDTDIVWIGYGIDAPEFNWNDYKDRKREGQGAAHAGE